MSFLITIWHQFQIFLSWLTLPIYYYCFWVFNIVDYFLILINLVDINLIFYVAVFFTLFILFIKDILCFVFNLKEIDSTEEGFDANKSRLSLFTPFRFFFGSLVKDNSNVFYDYIQYKRHTKTNKRH